jgi:hypothetical protein
VLFSNMPLRKSTMNALQMARSFWLGQEPASTRRC